LEYKNNNSQIASFDMIWIRPGTYMMGCSKADDKHCDNDETTHEVVLTKGFWISRFEITQQQWEVVMGNNPSYFAGLDTNEKEKLPDEQVSYDDVL
jgi:formylglycine-generating enzyme required for sulfatase activity